MGRVRGCTVKSPYCFSRGPKGGSRTHARPVTAVQGIRHLVPASWVQYPHIQIIKWLKLLKTEISHCCLSLRFPGQQWRLSLGVRPFPISVLSPFLLCLSQLNSWQTQVGNHQRASPDTMETENKEELWEQLAFGCLSYRKAWDQALEVQPIAPGHSSVVTLYNTWSL